MEYVFLEFELTNVQVMETDMEGLVPAITTPYRVHLNTGPGMGN